MNSQGNEKVACSSKETYYFQASGALNEELLETSYNELKIYQD